ncbi:ABC transporter permease [Aquihabitans sp. McL0605]|uniref:ABC transporter permease n=1 Tax=Aquihabitans sp. McL0605 TaxID=3415671 RepID=UPI003CE86498
MLLIGKRLLQLIVVFVCVTFFTVLLISMVPGKPEVLVIPFDSTGHQREQFREDNHLDRSIFIQWGYWAKDFVRGDMGNYYTSTGTNPVRTQIGRALPISALLILYVQIVSLGIAIPLAVWAAYRSGSRADKLFNAGAFGCISLPGFAVALIATYIFGVKMSLVPTDGYTSPSQGLGQHFRSMAVPVLALSLGQIAVYMRLLRSDLVTTLQEDFILMAKAKGISNRRVLWRHALRPSSLTLLTVAGLSIGTLIGGALVVEYLLRIPGMGTLIGTAVASRQYVALQSSVALIAIFFVLMNFLIDYLYTVLDPRIRERRS